MATLIGNIVADIARFTGLKGASSTVAAVSHCDAIGVAGAKAITVKASPILAGGGFNIGSLGLGLGLSSLGPVFFFAAGTATVYGYSKFRNQGRLLKQDRRTNRLRTGVISPFNALFNVAPAPKINRKRRLFSVLGFSIWR